jgi:hypothetical protein
VSTPDMTHAVWRKSSRSNGGGNECVEVAFVWRKSSRSNGSGNECVEVAFVPGATALRDSKNPDGGTLVLPATGWHAFRLTTKASR